MEKKLGIVLSGGGARGAYQIGVLEALKEAGILEDAEMYSGASVGSLNAALLAMGDLEKAKNIWLNMDDGDLFTSDESFLKKLFKKGVDLVYKGYYTSDKLEEMIRNMIDFKALHNNDIYVATSHVGHNEPSFWELISLNIRGAFSKESLVEYPNLRELTDEDIVQTLLASCAIPIVFKPVRIHGETYYDGGVLDNTPCKPLVDNGCTDIILIDLFRVRFKSTLCPKNVNLHVIKPTKGLRRILDFSNKEMLRRFELGKLDGEAFAKNYQKQ